jgi:hypothetical protein
VSTRNRLLTFGLAGLAVLAGALCAVFVSGLVGSVLAIALILFGLSAALLLVFLEVGLSEDRARAEEEARTSPSPPGRSPRRRLRGASRRRGDIY